MAYKKVPSIKHLEKKQYKPKDIYSIVVNSEMHRRIKELGIDSIEEMRANGINFRLELHTPDYPRFETEVKWVNVDDIQKVNL